MSGTPFPVTSPALSLTEDAISGYGNSAKIYSSLKLLAPLPL